ncbi:DUF4232 domain-containing protein [Streptomyces sp. NPDC094143]|uniref:DUF4232 domain-containing protein n=1 Tax=Streptomyces sp. NPDC094143 TaxID=3155310 RepID=UPI00332FD21F
MKHRPRTAITLAALLGTGLLMTACEDGGSAEPSSSTSAGTPSSAAKSPSAAAGDKADSEGQQGASGSGTGSGGSSGSGEGSSDEAKDKSGYGQGCGTNDLVWGYKTKTQGGGYVELSAKAKPGITCVLPGGHPTIAFGSGGIEAAPAEQTAGEEITLSGSKTVYAGVAPKTTTNDGGVEYTTVIVATSDSDPNPTSVPTGTILVDKPLVTNWHTNPQEAVPFTS